MSDGNGTLPEGWEATTFGEVFDFKGGSQPPKKEFADAPHNGYVRLLQIRDFASDQFPVYIKDADRWPKCDVDDVMIARYGASLGRVLTGMAGAYNVALIKMIFSRENIDAGWARYFLMSDHFQSPIHLLSRSAQNGFNKKEVSPIEVQLPPLPEQRRIVSAIESLQARSSRAREALNEVSPLLDQFRQSVLQAAFSGRLTADWRAAHPDVEPASELLERIRTERRERWEQSELAKYEAKGKKPPKNWKDKYKEPEPVDKSDLPGLPDGWAWGVTEELCSAIVDCPHSTPKWTERGKLCVRTTEFRAGHLDLTNVKFVSDETFQKRIERLKPEPGDVLYSREGGILGLACQVPNGIELCLGQRMMLMRPDAHISASLVMHWLNSPSIFLDRVQSKIQGVASPHVNVGEVKRFPVPVPPAKEQPLLIELTEQALQAIDEQFKLVAESESSLTQLDQSILAKAFRGELVPQDPNDEPASELLARIRATREQAKTTTKKKSKKKRKTASSK